MQFIYSKSGKEIMNEMMNPKDKLPETIDFFGKKFKINIPDYYKNNEKVQENIGAVKSAIKAFCSTGLYNYLVKINSVMMDEINNDPYYKEKTCKSGKDLIDAIKNDSTNINKGFKIFIKDYDGILNIFIAGEYWLDPEHGFSINFPNGKVVKYDGKDKFPKFNNKYTNLAGYDMAL